MSKKIAAVTGANRGIGYEIVKQLAEKDFTVILTSRDKAKGEEAANTLKESGLDVRFYQLDVASEDSILNFKKFVDKEFGRLDVLINNAAVFLDRDASGESSVFTVKLDTVRRTMESNLYGPLRLCQICVPLMEKHGYGRIINFTSGLGQISDMGGGYPAYRFSKVAINALTKMLVAEIKSKNILVNSMCPGWVRTEMGGPNAVKSIPEGADTAIYLATLSDDGPNGKFFRDRNIIPW